MSQPQINQAEILADSIYSDAEGCHRLTTFKLKIHRFILPELTRHRCFSFSVASHRAIPVEKIIQSVETDPAWPIEWGLNQPGMVADNVAGETKAAQAERIWRTALANAVNSARELAAEGIHKQLANRLLEPFAWCNLILSGTDYENFFGLRLAKDAQPEIRAVAEAMFSAYTASTPRDLGAGEWHIPFVDPAGLTVEDIAILEKIARSNPEFLWYSAPLATSAARCARVSYNRHDATENSIDKDFELFGRLVRGLHVSPLEHQATPVAGTYGNFRGWKQLRKFLPVDTKTHPAFTVV